MKNGGVSRRDVALICLLALVPIAALALGGTGAPGAVRAGIAALAPGAATAAGPATVVPNVDGRGRVELRDGPSSTLARVSAGARASVRP